MTLKFDKIKNRLKHAAAVHLRSRLLVLLLLLPLVLGAEFQTHTVKKGDNLYNLGKKYGVSVDQLQKLNNLNGNQIFQNQVLKIKEIPAPAVIAPKATTPAPEPPAPVVIPRAETPTTADQGTLSSAHYYTVEAKDNLYRISKKHDILLADLLKWNGFADVSHVIHPGDRLVVKDPASSTPTDTPTVSQPTESLEPAVAAVQDTVVIEKIYVVQRKDTLYKIATANGMTVDELKKLNNLTSNSLSVGQKLYLAGTPPLKTTTDKITPLSEEEIEKSDTIRSDLAMPAYGLVTSEFGLRGGRPHKGIDIAGKTGTPIYAVLDGVVVYSGLQGAYGNVVVIEHPDFVMSVYAHNEKNVVKVDDHVNKGQIIAYMGATGDATGPHLHFEYRLKGKAINPRKVLPQK